MILKIYLTLASLALIYKSTISSGDPTSLFSNLAVLFAMYLITYEELPKDYKLLKVTKNLVFFVGGICFLGWIEILTVLEDQDNGQYYVSIATDMKLGTVHIINVHYFFLALSVILMIIAGIESFVIKQIKKLETHNAKDSKKLEKGA